MFGVFGKLLINNMKGKVILTELDEIITQCNQQVIKLANIKNYYQDVLIENLISAKKKDEYWYELKNLYKRDIKRWRLNVKLLRAIKKNGLIYQNQRVEFTDFFENPDIINYLDLHLDDLKMCRVDYNTCTYRIIETGRRGLGTQPYQIGIEIKNKFFLPV